MTDRPGFRVTRYEIHDDEVIEIESIASEESELDELLKLFDEILADRDKTREAHKILFAEFEKQRDELAGARIELRRLTIDERLRSLGILEPSERLGRKFVPDGRGGEIEVTTQGDVNPLDGVLDRLAELLDNDIFPASKTLGFSKECDEARELLNRLDKFMGGNNGRD